MANLTTIGNVKEWLGLDSCDDDALLTRMVSALSRYIQSWLNRDLLTASYSETRDGSGSRKIMMSNYPVTAVSSLTIDGLAIPQAVDSRGSGFMITPNLIVLVGGYAFTQGMQNVVISYTAGFAVTPPELEQACIELIAMRYKERDRIGQVSKSIGGETVTFSQKDFPADVLTILNNYKKVVSL